MTASKFLVRITQIMMPYLRERQCRGKNRTIFPMIAVYVAHTCDVCFPIWTSRSVYRGPLVTPDNVFTCPVVSQGFTRRHVAPDVPIHEPVQPTTSWCGSVFVSPLVHPSMNREMFLTGK